METITIPSPTAFLSSPVLKSALEPPPPLKRKNTKSTTLKSAVTTEKPTGIVKPKQSKSRNGCVTCKAKRLKCDETKPSCEQCQRRNVSCGGYKKDFKWRPFEETTFINKVAPAKQKRNSIILNKAPEIVPAGSPSSEESACTTPGGDIEQDEPIPQTFQSPAPVSPVPEYSPTSFGVMKDDTGARLGSRTPPFLRDLLRPAYEADLVTRSLSTLFDDPIPASPNSARPSFSGQSPRLIDLLLPGSELNARPETLFAPPISFSPGIGSSFMLDQDPFSTIDYQEQSLDDGVEETIGGSQLSDSEMWMLNSLSATRSPRNISRSPRDVSTIAKNNLISTLYRQPDFHAGSPEMLMLRFDRQTCGILSVKDGPTENPWRTLIWPLASSSPPLYHAIASMTAFHTAKERPNLRVDGVAHMRKSICDLRTSLRKNTIPAHAALATTLVLAFAESWDLHISTGMEHLRGARALVSQAVEAHRQSNLVGDDLARLRFLCNTWVYMDVIARLTTLHDYDTTDHDNLSPWTMPMSSSNLHEIDPLMGCASSLFPLVGKVANLCRKVRNMEDNSIAIISQAMDLKQAIVQWSPPSISTIESPEDPTSEVQHALQTAEAYRYATLLYLHQAVPQIPSVTSAELAKKVLIYLATVPLSSRLVIVQIYPLMAAGCEAYDKEDRQWVEERWECMISRMWIGNIDRCRQVTREVWRRRDEAEADKIAAEMCKQRPLIMHSESSTRRFEEEMAMDDFFSYSDMLNGEKQLSSFSGQARSQTKRIHGPIDEDMERDLTVRGRLHWVDIMAEWKWEVLLG